MDEGLANYMAGYWNVLDLMQVRDAALSDNVPRMSQFETAAAVGPAALLARPCDVRVHRGEVGQGRPAPVPLLAAQERGRRRRERLRGSAQGRSGGVRRHVRPVPQGALQAVPRQGAAGGLRPQPRAQARHARISRRCCRSRPSPSGDMLAAVVGNIARLRTRHRPAVRQERRGDREPDQGLRPHAAAIEYIATAGGLRGNLVPWIAWAPVGDVIAYFARTGKVKTLILHNVATGKIEKRVRPGDGRRPRIARRSVRTASTWRSRRSRTASPTSFRVDIATGDRHQPDQGRHRGLLAGVFAGRQDAGVLGAHQQQRQAVPAGPGHRRRRSS